MHSADGDKTRVRVLYCILDNRFGGPHRLALSTAQRLRAEGVETVFLLGQKTTDAWRPDGFQSHLLRNLQCFYRRHPVWNLLKFLLWLPFNLARIRKLIRSHDVDIVHIDGVTNFVPALAASMCRVPVVWLYNDHLFGPLSRLLPPLLTSLSATVVVQGEKLRAERTQGNARLAAKTTVLYSGVDTELFRSGRYDAASRARIRERLGVPLDGPLIGTIANLNRLKGHTYFLGAAARIKKQVESARFLIVGRKLDTDPGYWDRLQELTARLGLERDAFFVGFREDIQDVLAALDVFVLASVLESCPVVVLEAMATGVPVVGTDVGAVSEQIVDGHSGSIVPCRDAEAISRAVLAYLTAPQEDLDATTEAARKRVEDKFSLDRIAVQQKCLYRKLCDGGALTDGRA
jgi:glycosyltransferase involved in cell wall biosynthesis